MTPKERILRVENPFEILVDQLSEIKTMLTDLQKQQNGTKAGSDSKVDYLSVNEAAEFLQVTPGSIYRYVMTGILPKKKFGNKLYFKKKNLEELIEKGV